MMGGKQGENDGRMRRGEKKVTGKENRREREEERGG